MCSVTLYKKNQQSASFWRHRPDQPDPSPRQAGASDFPAADAAASPTWLLECVSPYQLHGPDLIHRTYVVKPLEKNISQSPQTVKLVSLQHETVFQL